MNSPLPASDYPLAPEKLQEFVSFQTRAQYQAALGVDPPTYDKSRKTKTWADPSAADDPPGSQRAYSAYVDVGGLVRLTALVVPSEEAASVNLYGYHSYPAYVVGPTGATDRYGQALDPIILSLRDQAVAIASELGLSQESVSELTGLGYVYPESELRRVWEIVWTGTRIGSLETLGPLEPRTLNVGLLLKAQNSNGVGAPGHWMIGAADPIWISDVPGNLGTQNPAWPVPMRKLYANERIVISPFGWYVALK